VKCSDLILKNTFYVCWYPNPNSKGVHIYVSEKLVPLLWHQYKWWQMCATIVAHLYGISAN